MALTRTIFSALNKKILWNSVNARSAYANAFEFGPRDFGAEEILPPPLISPQSDLGRRADSRWVLPQISSFFLFSIAYFARFSCEISE